MVARYAVLLVDRLPFAQPEACPGGRPSSAGDGVEMCSFVQSCAITQCSLAAKGPRGRGLERIFAGRCRCSSAHDEEESEQFFVFVVGEKVKESLEFSEKPVHKISDLHLLSQILARNFYSLYSYNLF